MIEKGFGYLPGAYLVVHKRAPARLGGIVKQADILSQLLDATPDATIVVDAKGLIVLANEQTELMFGYHRSELLGRSIELLIPDDLRELHAAHRDEYIAGPRPVKLGRELVAVRRDGTIFPTEINLKSFHMEGNLYVVAALRDISERKRAEEEFREQAAQLEARNRELDAFSHTAAHDLKSPLAVVQGYLQMFLEEHGAGLSPEGRSLVDEAIRLADKMKQIIESLLLLAQLRDATFSFGPVTMRPVVEAAVQRAQPDIEARNITVVVSSDLPSVLGYGPWLEEALTNLVINAAKYIGRKNPDPRIEIHAQREGNTVRYQVTDNGVGIDPQHRERLFEMFARLHSEQAEGLGLGLSIVQRIITKLNGQVGVESTPGQGSTFWFALPAAEGEATA